MTSASEPLDPLDPLDSRAPDTGPRPVPGAWAVAVVLWLYYMTPLVVPGGTDDPVKTVLIVVPPLAALGLLVLRRRHPVAIALFVGALLLVSPGVIGAAFVAQATAARWIGRSAVALLSCVWLIGAKMLALLAGPRASEWTGASTVEMTIAAAGMVIATLTGWLARSRAAEHKTRADVDRARRDAEQTRLERARMLEREQIAREMHDVLAHRLSLVAMHAGALAFRDDLDTETTRSTARTIQRNAQQSLDELRTVLSSLRGAEDVPEPPQPSLVELRTLIAEADRTQAIDLDLDLDPSRVPARTSRHAYRIVQEALTNARKHAPGAPVSVVITGSAGGSVHAVISNPIADLASPNRSGSGLGLIGIGERVAHLGGTARFTDTDGRFTMEVSLPWVSAT